jgi:hypothetical protein
LDSLGNQGIKKHHLRLGGQYQPPVIEETDRVDSLF